MAVDINSEDGQIIRQLIPFTTLSSDQFFHLCKLITIQEAKSGVFLFKRKDTIDEMFYLIEGTVILQGEQLKIESIAAGTDSSRFAIAHQLPRKIDAHTKTRVRFFSIKSNYMDFLPAPNYEIKRGGKVIFDEPEDESEDELEYEDYLSKFLDLDIFRALSPVHLQQLMIGLSEVIVKEGETIISQGESDNYYFIIQKGQCLVTHRSLRNRKEIKLEQLEADDSFGEESLLSGDPSYINVTAITEVKLSRISKEKFISAVKQPSLNYASYSQVLESNNSLLLDVRPSDEYEQHHLPGSVNLPFFMIRTQVGQFDRKKTIFVICADGKRSEAVAFFLYCKGLTALVVENGMKKEFQRISSLKNADENITNEIIIDESLIKEQEDLEEEQAGDDTLELNSHNIVSEEDSESVDFQSTILQLRQTIQQVTIEKKELENKYRTLFKQTEKLKAILVTHSK